MEMKVSHIEKRGLWEKMAERAAVRSGDHVVSAEKDGIGLEGIGRGPP